MAEFFPRNGDGVPLNRSTRVQSVMHFKPSGIMETAVYKPTNGTLQFEWMYAQYLKPRVTSLTGWSVQFEQTLKHYFFT